jgi:predicted alpha/beta superfamily hydrolase
VGDPCYLIGNVNNWQEKGLLVGEVPGKGQTISITLEDLAEGVLDFKLTRGSWATCACSVEGKLGKPYSVKIDGNTDITVDIDAWWDDFQASTASPQVHIMDKHFHFPTMNIYRRVWIYLPKDYESSGMHYPVLYMHDGQHLFDEATSVGRMGPIEWRVDETIDQSAEKAIVVAIDHASDFKGREREYLVNPVNGNERVYGRAYLEDIVDVLKPFVDTHYRTLSDQRHTALLGSSLGGLLNLYAGLRYASVFGTVGIFSPSIWIDRAGVDRWLDNAPVDRESALMQFFYLYCGGMEVKKVQGASNVAMAEDMVALATRLKEYPSRTVYENIDPEGKHGALYWQREFPKFYACWQDQINK